MSIDLEPREVLEHLHALGYCNISPQQLRDFMKDLKKLIRHDMRRAELRKQLVREVAESEQSVAEDSAVECCSPPRSSRLHYDTAAKASDSSRVPDSTPCPFDVESTSEESNNQTTSRPNSRCTKKENAPSSRPPSSFIRTVPSKPRGKSDPVALYHYYQSVWSQFPQPGEDPRAQLRWTVRHQMMGAQRQKPTISHAASIERLKNRPEWQF